RGDRPHGTRRPRGGCGPSTMCQHPPNGRRAMPRSRSVTAGWRVMHRFVVVACVSLLVLSACSGSSTKVDAPPPSASSPPRLSTPTTASSHASPADIHKIKHVVVIMQENRSFDTYFGRYPGADGIPEGVCVPNPRRHHCQRPFVDHSDVNGGGPHGADSARLDVNGGKMNGFVI